jgi:hypothetical protein
MLRRYLSVVLPQIVSLTLAAVPAQGMPSFAKKTGMACSACHSAWPMLNAYGRRFKENGYVVERDEEINGGDHVTAPGLGLYRNSPLSAALVGYPVDRTGDGPTQLRPFHEFEVYLAGNAFRYFSYMAEVEAEDEAEWNVFTEAGFVGFHPRDELNIVVGYGQVYHVDPYQPLADGGRRMTRSRPATSNLGFSTSQRLRMSTPQFAVHGRAAKKVFYAAGLTSGSEDFEGSDPKDAFGRVAVDVVPQLMIGGHVWSGSARLSDTAPDDADFTRAGVDVQFQNDRFSVFGAYLSARDDVMATGTTLDNDVLSVTGLYFFKLDKRPIVVPIVRIDRYTNGPNRTFTDGAFNVTGYPLENIQLAFEYFHNLDRPAGVVAAKRATLLFKAMF